MQSNEIFNDPKSFDFLQQIGNLQEVDDDNLRDSIYVKFDPCYLSGGSPSIAISKINEFLKKNSPDSNNIKDRSITSSYHSPLKNLEEYNYSNDFHTPPESNTSTLKSLNDSSSNKRNSFPLFNPNTITKSFFANKKNTHVNSFNSLGEIDLAEELFSNLHLNGDKSPTSPQLQNSNEFLTTRPQPDFTDTIVKVRRKHPLFPNNNLAGKSQQIISDLLTNNICTTMDETLLMKGTPPPPKKSSISSSSNINLSNLLNLNMSNNNNNNNNNNNKTNSNLISRSSHHDMLEHPFDQIPETAGGFDNYQDALFDNNNNTNNNNAAIMAVPPFNYGTVLVNKKKNDVAKDCLENYNNNNNVSYPSGRPPLDFNTLLNPCDNNINSLVFSTNIAPTTTSSDATITMPNASSLINIDNTVATTFTSGNSSVFMENSLKDDDADYYDNDNHLNLTKISSKLTRNDSTETYNKSSPDENLPQHLLGASSNNNQQQQLLMSLKVKCDNLTLKNTEISQENKLLLTILNEYNFELDEIRKAYCERFQQQQSVLPVTQLPEYQNTLKERDQLLEDVKGVELAFSDLHRRYEKLKTILENYKTNEETLIKINNEKDRDIHELRKGFNDYKHQSEHLLKNAYEEIDKLKNDQAADNLALSAKLRKLEMKSYGLERDLAQKSEENSQLNNMCDELIAKMEHPRG